MQPPVPPILGGGEGVGPVGSLLRAAFWPFIRVVPETERGGICCSDPPSIGVLGAGEPFKGRGRTAQRTPRSDVYPASHRTHLLSSPQNWGDGGAACAQQTAVV